RDDLVTGVQTCALPILIVDAYVIARISHLRHPRAHQVQGERKRPVLDCISEVVVEVVVNDRAKPAVQERLLPPRFEDTKMLRPADRKSTRLNSSHQIIS